ncbi:hypothetical protein HK100_010392 [Physocladia obscura]|uniref:Proteasome assembly chaperone 2 n=1 Tax=Physocladia obscura TaxID=109957 RepID=A0AAD5T395_9FUNG|nr:hypothetical protein HK100_010392 [Physocladia obscura]
MALLELQIEGVSQLNQVVVVAWLDSLNAAASRILEAALSSHDSALFELGRAIPFLSDSNAIANANKNERANAKVDIAVANFATVNVSLVSIGSFKRNKNEHERVHVACALVRLLLAQNVRRVILVAALDVKLPINYGSNTVLTASFPPQTHDNLPPTSPLNDAFLGALIPFLHLSQTQLQSTLICVAAKKERTAENGQILQSVNPRSVDTFLPTLSGALTDSLAVSSLKFNASAASAIILESWKVSEHFNDVENKDTFSLMYL